MCENRTMCLRINNINPNPISSLHKDIKITLIERHPSWMVPRIWCFNRTNKTQVTLLIFLVSPDLVGSQVSRIEVSFRGVEDHAMDASLWLILVVLDALLQATLLVHREDVTESGMVVEWVSIDIERRLLCCKYKNCSCIGIRL